VGEDQETLAAWAAERGLLYRETSFALPQVTQLLRHGFMREVTGLARGDLPGGLAEGWLAHVAYVYEGTNDLKRSPFTLVLVQAPESLGFADRVLCHDRDLSKLDMSNPDSDREVIKAPDRSVRLESEAFLGRFALFVDSDQDENSVWRLFSPSLIDWLTRESPTDFSFELQNGALTGFVPGSLTDPDRLDELCRATARVMKEVTRIGEGTAGDGPLDPGSRRGRIESRLAETRFDAPPDSVKQAAKAFRKGLVIGDEGWKLGAEAFFREQSGAAGFDRIEPSAFQSSHIQTFLPGKLAQAAAGRPGTAFENSFLVFTDDAEFDSMGWTVLVADGMPAFGAVGGMPTGVSSERGQIKVNTDGRSLIFTVLDGGPRDRDSKELNSFLDAVKGFIKPDRS